MKLMKQENEKKREKHKNQNHNSVRFVYKISITNKHKMQYKQPSIGCSYSVLTISSPKIF